MARRTKLRSQAGFTLIELLVIAIIIGILVVIALPHFIGAQDRAREALVRGNMRTVQISADSYALDYAGHYPPDATGPFKSYFPGGGCDGTTDGKAPVNPFTSLSEWPIPGSIMDVAASRLAAPGKVGSAGQIEYSAITTGGGSPTAYAIRGANKNGSAIEGKAANTTLVLSNQ